MHCWARYLFRAVVAALVIGQLLTGCGQKGKLFLPRADAKSTAAKPARAVAPAASAQTKVETPPPPQAQGAGEGLQVLDEVQSTTPDLSGF
jgi:predicted small lipoprotein YifL